MQRGFLKGLVGFPEAEEKILAPAHDPHFAGLRRHYVLRRRFSHRAVYLFVVLGLLRFTGTTQKVLG